MDSLAAFALGNQNRGKEAMVFDWEAAAKVINERKPAVAEAGLRDDWEWTGGVIWRDGKPVTKAESYTYLASTWAVPELMIDGELIPCFKMASATNGWDSDTSWPPEAIAVLEA